MLTAAGPHRSSILSPAVAWLSDLLAPQAGRADRSGLPGCRVAGDAGQVWGVGPRLVLDVTAEPEAACTSSPRTRTVRPGLQPGWRTPTWGPDSSPRPPAPQDPHPPGGSSHPRPHPAPPALGSQAPHSPGCSPHPRPPSSSPPPSSPGSCSGQQACGAPSPRVTTDPFLCPPGPPPTPAPFPTSSEPWACGKQERG